MSEENVELVEAAYDAFATSGVEAFSAYWADDIEWEAIGGRFRGGDAGRAYMQEWFKYFEDFTVEALEFIDAATDRVVVWVRIGGRVRGVGSSRPLRTSGSPLNSATTRSHARWNTPRLRKPSKPPGWGNSGSIAALDEKQRSAR
jgi:hypothetical protein